MKKTKSAYTCSECGATALPGHQFARDARTLSVEPHGFSWQ